MWDTWKSLFVKVLDRHAPIREKRVKSKPNVPWLTSTIKKQIRERDRLKSLAIRRKSENMACCKELCDELSDKTDIFLNLSTTSLIVFFGQKKNKLTWRGTLNDLKTFVSTIIDEKAAESAVWRSTSG
ncbi:Hypothetical predicted protein, partial [Paramuricea clavata]